MKTKLIYLTDSYKQTLEAKVVEVTKKGNQSALILDQTILYPQGGGQPADTGTITGSKGKLDVSHVSYNHGQPLHLGQLAGRLIKNSKVTIEVDWDRRLYLMRVHTAGHILHEAAVELIPETPSVDGTHGIGNKNFLKFQGVIDQTLLPELEAKVQEIVQANEPITTKFMKKAEMEKEGINTPVDLPKNKPLRIMQVGTRLPMPDGGTHTNSTGDVGTITLKDIEYNDGNSIIHYTIATPQTSAPQLDKATKLSKVALSSRARLANAKGQAAAGPSTSLHEFETLLHQTVTLFKKESASSTPNYLTIKYLGKKGQVNHLTSLIPSLPKTSRGEAGKTLNLAKSEIASLISKSKTKTRHPSSSGWLDVTAPGTPTPQGHLHPVSQTIDEVTRIFNSIGFTRVRYPEVDWDWYVFESLNFTKDHPARDDWETFWVDTKPHPKKGVMVLTTHTSNGQVREMERLKKPPIRMINIAKCYRRQQDAIHTAMFHQFEGLVVDRGISVQHLKGTIDYFARHFYGPKAKSRIRPYNFPFTEPSFEVDFSCTICNGTAKINGKRCKFCKGGWHEVGGAGMVHPNVLKAGGIDANTYTGFAFGWGIERTYTLKPGLKLDDIRLLYSNNLDFLAQF